MKAFFVRCYVWIFLPGQDEKTAKTQLSKEFQRLKLGMYLTTRVAVKRDFLTNADAWRRFFTVYVSALGNRPPQSESKSTTLGQFSYNQRDIESMEGRELARIAKRASREGR